MQNKTIFRRLMTFIISLLFVFNSSVGVWANSQTRIAIGTVNAIQEGQATVSAIKEDNPLGVAAHGVGTALNVVAALSGLKAVVPTNSSYMEKLQCMKSAGNESAAKASAGAVEGGSGSTEIVSYYPENNGAIRGTEKYIHLREGEIIDRYGKATGKYFSPAGTPIEMRALPYDTELSKYHQYVVVKPFEVEASTIAPAFNNMGLGTQYRSPVSVKILLKRGIIKEVGGN